MRFEQPVDNVVTRFPELRVERRERTVPSVSHEEIAAAVARARRLQARCVRETLGPVIVRPVAAFARALASLASALVREYRRERDRRETIRELRGLEDYLLRDIGLERDQIVSVADALVEAKYDEHQAAPESPSATEVEWLVETPRAA